MKRPAVATLLLVLLAGRVGADPAPRRVFFNAVGLRFVLPAGFEARQPVDSSPALLGTWVRPGVGQEGPVLLQWVALAGELREGPPAQTELSAWHGSDPFPFHDRMEATHWHGLVLHTRVGTATVNGRPMLRLVTVLPLVDHATRMVVVAPASRAQEAREVFDTVLASAQGPRAWQTASERLREQALRAVVLVALAGMLVYATLALVVFRRRDVWRPGRAAALFTLAGLWAVAALLAPSDQWRVRAQDVALAVVFAQRGWRLWQRS